MSAPTPNTREGRARPRQTVAQLLGPMVLKAIIAGLPTVEAELIALARRWMARQPRTARGEADQAGIPG